MLNHLSISTYLKHFEMDTYNIYNIYKFSFIFIRFSYYVQKCECGYNIILILLALDMRVYK